MSRRLTKELKSIDTVARLGGDEFNLILEGINNTNNVSIIARKIIDSIKSSLSIGQFKLEVTCSIGVCLYPNDGLDSATLIKHADAAMYHAKGAGKKTSNFTLLK